MAVAGAATGLKADLRALMARTRARTLRLLDHVPDDFLSARVHDFYSPVGWHFGHVGMTEEYWVQQGALGRSPRDAALSFLFANLPENPKDNRVHIPPREGIVAYLAGTRRDALAALEEADLASPDPLLHGGYAWHFAVQHECQHQETIIELLQLIRQRIGEVRAMEPVEWYAEIESVMEPIPGGRFWMGSNDPRGYDNEKPAHEVEVAPFALDLMPVTAFEWSEFIEGGGYRCREWWSDEGWAWREREGAERPEYWRPYSEEMGWTCWGPLGLRAIDPEEPAASLSWFEADAYARWAGKRLPTEAEWEFAARHDPATGQSRTYPWGSEEPTEEQALFDFAPWGREEPVGPGGAILSAHGVPHLAGGVWEWTASPFLPYPGFEAFPYDGYSKDHMDGAHFVCRGGSWATDPLILRSSFRNWYVPTYRQGLLGLRCAR